jgi:hypothetical protein
MLNRTRKSKYHLVQQFSQSVNANIMSVLTAVAVGAAVTGITNVGIVPMLGVGALSAASSNDLTIHLWSALLT